MRTISNRWGDFDVCCDCLLSASRHDRSVYIDGKLSDEDITLYPCSCEAWHTAYGVMPNLSRPHDNPD